MFENLRVNTQVCGLTASANLQLANHEQGLSNSHLETERNLKTNVLPILDRLHKEIKSKAKDLQSGAVKSAKEVEKARNTTQRHIELLGQQTASHDSAGGKMEPLLDPYVVHRGIHHRLNKQVMEENNHKNDLIAVQNNFIHFEAHVIEVIQQAMVFFNEFIAGQAQKTQMIYGDMVAQGQQITPDFEWQKFTERHGHVLIHPETPDRAMEHIEFPNQNHQSTKPLIEGTLERKSRNKLSLVGYSPGHYAVTSSKFLHEFKDTDNYKRDPTPELSIYLPEATIGITNGDKFNVKGRDVSGGFGSKLSGNSEIQFKASTAEEALKWFEVIRSVAGSGPGIGGGQPAAAGSPHAASQDEEEAAFVPKSLDANPRPPSPTFPLSRLVGSKGHAAAQPTKLQTTGGAVTGQPAVASPVAATPTKAKPGA
jgi:hypothetical protein